MNWKTTGRLEFTNALITEVGMPALDGASKDAAFITVKIAPEFTTWKKASGEVKAETAGAPKAQKKWLTGNFKFKLSGLEDAFSRVAKIDSIVVKQPTAEETGGSRGAARAAANLVISNLVVTLADSSAESVLKWADDFIVKGKNSDREEKSGALDYLDAQQKTLFTLEFDNVGIVKLSRETAQSGSESIRRVKAEMYVENICLK